MPTNNIVVDATVVIRAVLPSKTHTNTLEHFVTWRRSGRQIYAPEIVFPEVVSIVSRAIFERWINQDEGGVAVDDIFRLGMMVIPTDASLCQASLVWAGRLGQSKAYGSFYLAVAEHLNAEFWTGDERLYNRSQQLGANWVHLIN